jgi:hypothetical protein
VPSQLFRLREHHLTVVGRVDITAQMIWPLVSSGVTQESGTACGPKSCHLAAIRAVRGASWPPLGAEEHAVDLVAHKRLNANLLDAET